MMTLRSRFVLAYFLFLAAANNICFAQTKKNIEELAPFQKNKNLPSFSIRLLDSITVFNTKSIVKGRPSVFILFSPDCDHCAKLSKEVKSNTSIFDSVNLIMVSPPMSFFEIKKFSFVNGIAHMPNAIVGVDIDFFFGSYFQAASVPFVVLYNKDKKLFSVLKSLKNIDELRAEIEKI